jgi:Mg-chelatase subunit ChlD
MRTESAPRSRIGLVLLFVTAALLFGGGTARAAQNIDLVVLVDTSESMFPYFDDLMNYLVQDLLTTRLHRGDTFHLISFSGLPEVEISLEVNSEEAARQAFSRVLLLHALGRYTDLPAAMQFLYKYVKELPETNPKQIIIITDGVNDPPPGSPNTDPAAVKAAVTSVAQAMRKEGWSVSILRVPPQPDPSAGTSYLGNIADALGVPVVPYPAHDKGSVTGVTTGYPTLVFPAALGKVGTRFSAPFRVKNWKTEPIIVSLSSVQSEGTELLEKKVSVTVPAGNEAALDVPLRLPLSYPTGAHDAKVQLVFDDDIRISPSAGTLSFNYTGKGGFPIPRLTFLYVLYIILGLALIYGLVRLFLYMRKKLTETPLTGLARTRAGTGGGDGRSAAAARSAAPAGGRAPLVAPTPEKSRSPAHVPLMGATPVRSVGRGHVALMDANAPHAAPGGARVRPTVTSLQRSMPRPSLQQSSLPPLIEMRVDQQNHRVGFRNVHRIGTGAARSVGGRFSSFLVFLVPIPANTAEIRNVDGRYVFTPVRAELFPDLAGPMEDCLGKEIRMVNAKGRELTIHFREWVSPLDEINRIMRLAKS